MTFFPEHSKLGFWWDPLIQTWKSISLKFTEELSVMTMKNYAKFKRNWLVISKLTWGIWRILTWALESLKNFHFNGFLLSKVFIVWTKKVQRSYLSWNWRGIQNFERNRLVSKLTYGIWQILTWALESFIYFHFNGLLLSKVYIVQAKKVQRSYLSWNWRGIQNLERNRLVV